MTEQHAAPLKVTRTRLSLISALLGAVASVFVIFVMSQKNDPVLLHYVIRLTAYLFVTIAIATLPRKIPWITIIACYLVYAGFIFPRISWFYYMDTGRVNAESFYTHLYLFTYPAIASTIGFTWRLGGGSSGRALKIMWSGIIILFSGYLDVMWHTINPVQSRATTFEPSHIVAIVGRPVTFVEMIWFTVAHIPLLLILVYLPIDRWIDRLVGQEK